MVFQLNDFTDSEDESNTVPPSPVASTPRRAGPSSRAGTRKATPSSPAGSAAARVSASPRASASRDHGRGPSASSSGHPLRITLRTAPPQPTESTHQAERSEPYAISQRSSLSPPPPITLKLSKPPRTSLAEKATYSSSEDEQDEIPEPLYYAEDDVEADRSYPYTASKAKKPTSKKAKARPSSTLGTPRKASTSTTGSLGASVFGGSGSNPPAPAVGIAGASSGPAAGATGGGGKRKTYGWLAPSSVSASHSGPQQRESASGSAVSGKMKEEGSLGGRDDSEMEQDSMVVDDVPAVQKAPGPPAKKRQKKAPAGEGGPAKPGRKSQAQKKIKALLAESYLENPPHEGSSPNMGGMMSVDGTPEPLDLAQGSGPRGNTPPFERADPAKLGFPVFSRPIVVPEFSLGAFPRVTQSFAPTNGGDTAGFPRKEKVRTWKHHTSTFKGIAGGTLFYKAWARGPPSELGRLIAADREVKDIQRAAKKAGAAAAAANPVAPPLFNDSALLQPDSRPGLSSANSSESVFQVSSGHGADDDAASELGTADEPSAAATEGKIKIKVKGTGSKATAAAKKKAGAAAATGGAGPSKQKAKPKKSKLAQEIVVPVEMEGVEGDVAETEVVE